MVRPLFYAVRKPGGGTALHPVDEAIELLRYAVPWVRQWLSRAGHGHAIRGAWRLMSGRTRATPLVLFSHHCMSAMKLKLRSDRTPCTLCVCGAGERHNVIDVRSKRAWRSRAVLCAARFG